LGSQIKGQHAARLNPRIKYLSFEQRKEQRHDQFEAAVRDAV